MREIGQRRRTRRQNCANRRPSHAQAGGAAEQSEQKIFRQELTHKPAA